MMETFVTDGLTVLDRGGTSSTSKTSMASGSGVILVQDDHDQEMEEKKHHDRKDSVEKIVATVAPNSENLHKETEEENTAEVKSEDIEVFDEASQAILCATQAVEQAHHIVYRMKNLVNEFISIEGITDPLMVALQCCKDAATAVEGASSVWQEIHRQNLTNNDLLTYDDQQSQPVEGDGEEDREEGEVGVRREGERDEAEVGRGGGEVVKVKNEVTEDQEDNLEYKDEEIGDEDLFMEEESNDQVKATLRKSLKLEDQDGDYLQDDEFDDDDLEYDDSADEDYGDEEMAEAEAAVKAFAKTTRATKTSPSKKVKEEETKLLTCEKCDYTTRKKKNLQQHNKSQHMNPKVKADKKFSCNECDFSTQTEGKYRRHMLDKHKAKTIRCCLCKDIVPGKENFESHMKEIHPEETNHSCSVCKTEKKPPRTYFKYYREVGDMHECELCDYRTHTTSRKQAIRKHIRFHHFSAKILKCDQCSYNCKDASKLKEHTQAVHQGITFPCPWDGCSHQSRQKRNLKKHIDHVHHKIELKCTKCDFTTRNTAVLKDHTRMSHMEEKYFCDECTFVGPTHHSLNSHKAKIHNSSTKSEIREDQMKNITSWTDASGQTMFKCQLCDYSTNHYANIRYAHMNKHSGKTLRCDFCPYSTKYRTVLNSHINSRHKEHKYRCDQCNYTTNSGFHFRRHYESKHEGAVYKCEWCDYTTVRVEYLQKHQRKHQGKAFNCEFEGCSFVGPYLSDLKVHIDAVHKGVRHKCPECEYTSARKGDLNKHIKKVHGSEELILRCVRCRFATSIESALLQHVKEAHDPDLVGPILEEIKFQLGHDPFIGLPTSLPPPPDVDIKLSSPLTN